MEKERERKTFIDVFFISPKKGKEYKKHEKYIKNDLQI